ncbi:MAG: potassium-transporting ATPase subunit KdpB [Paludibacter sp.]|nr:potassium-transporting ATPase subunit KdpB [Paludibacter sp.]
MTTKSNKGIFNKKLLARAAKDSVKKLSPASLIKNPVIFIVGIGAVLTTIIVVIGLFQGAYSTFNLQIAIWLWFTVLFANFSEAIAEGRGKAQAESLRKNRTQTVARKMVGDKETEVLAPDLRKGDIVVCEVNDIIPSDGEVIEGIASVDESAITGESAPVIRESGGDRSAVTGGTKVLSDRILIRISADAGDTFMDRMIALVEGAKRQKTPNEIALTILLSGLTIIFLLAVVTLPAFFGYSLAASGIPQSHNLSIPVLIALLVCLIPTTIGGLLSAIGISGMDRLIQRNVIATSGRAIEAAGDVDVLLLDKTGTITLGNRMATNFVPAEGISIEELADAAQLSSLSDETPEGRSIVILAKEKFNIRGRDITNLHATFIPFTAQSRMSGVDLKTPEGKVHHIRKGSSEAIRALIEENNGVFSQKVIDTVSDLARQGATPLVVAEDNKVLGVIHLKDIVKGGIKQRFAELRQMGIKTVMITGDNSLTAAAIAAEAGVDDFMAEATPEDKLRRIREEQEKGHLVGMIGDGTNDAPALAQADVGIAMNSGTQAAREAGNMVDLDSNPTKLIEVVEVGKQLLMTRGALTTFSIANDVAKYFAIIPAISIALYAGTNGQGPLSALNIMKLGSPQSAILSAIIFNALIIIALIPLALKGVPYRPISANRALTKNLLIYGLGGLVAPFIGIKIIDLLINL